MQRPPNAGRFSSRAISSPRLHETSQQGEAHTRTGKGLRVAFVNRGRSRSVDESRLRRLLGGAARVLKASGEVSLVLSGDRTLRDLNARYRSKDRPTDVLSFPGPGLEQDLGDIVISLDTAARNAKRQG